MTRPPVTTAGQEHDVSSQTNAGPRRERTITGGIILITASLLATLLLAAGLIYATGTPGRHAAAITAAGCEPSLFISGFPCTTEQMIASQYKAIATPASQQLDTEMAAYTANQRRHLAAAEAALTAEVATEHAFDTSLAAMAFTPQNRATAYTLIQTATSNGTPVPLAAALFTPQLTVMAEALIQAGQARATLIAQQARSSSLKQLRSFNPRVRAANAAVQTDMNLILNALHSPPQAG
jgi:hypothetical protein